MIKSILSIFEKDWPWSNRSHRQDQFNLFQDWIDLLITKKINSTEKTNFSFVFDSFSPFFSYFLSKDQIAPSDLQSSIFFKDRQDQFAIVNLWKRSTLIHLVDLWNRLTGSIQSFDLLIPKKRWTNWKTKKLMIEFPTLLLIDLKGKKVLKIGGYIRLTLCVQVIVDYSEFRTEQ